MLLRSSSTPMLECLLASNSHDALEMDSSTCGEAALAKSISMSNSSLISGQGSLSQPCLHGISCDSASPVHAILGKNPGSSPHPTLSRVRKVQSESDLSTMGGSLSSTRVAADTPVSDDYDTDADGYGNCLYHFSGRKSSAGSLLSRRRSLGSLPLDLPFVFFSGGSSSAIPEEVEPTSYSSTSSEGDAIENMTCVFDKLALPVTGEVNGFKGIFQLNNVEDDEEYDDDSKAQLYHDTVALPMTKSEDVAFFIAPDATVSKLGRHMPKQVGFSTVPKIGMGGGYVGDGGSTTQVKEACGQLFGSKYGSDQVELAFTGGDGSRRGRPPSIGGHRGGGGGSDGYGHGVDMTETHYSNMLKENPGHPLLLRNYARFLADVKRDHGKAEEYYQRAILANPTDGELLGQYAKMIWEVQHDRERAATYFERAVQAASDNSYVMAAYASFLWSLEEEEVLESSASKVPTALSLVPVGLT